MPVAGPTPTDDPTIGNDEDLYLRVFPIADMLARRSEGGFRPVSGCFRSDEPLSVDLSSLCTAAETRDRDLSHPFHVAVITAGAARAVGCLVVRDPLPGNAAHGLLYGSNASGNGSLSMKQARTVARGARIVLLHPNAPLPEASPTGGIQT
jgi:hypothetical protein